MSSLLVYAALGLAAGVTSLAFSRSLLWLRATFGRARRLPKWAGPAATAAMRTGGVTTIFLHDCAHRTTVRPHETEPIDAATPPGMLVLAGLQDPAMPAARG